MNVSTQTPCRFYKISAYPLLQGYTMQLNNLEKQLLERNTKKKLNSAFKQLKSINNKIQIGANGTRLSTEMYMKVNWTCYKTATRDLCYMIFGRETLGTHTLTGRLGPGAVMYNTTPKPQLPCNLVEDIVHHIMSKFDVRQIQIFEVIRQACRNSSVFLRARKAKQNLRSFAKSL